MSDLKHDVTAERWAILIKERMDSGMTIKEWCRERGIKESQYYYWLKILRRKESENREQNQQVPPFVELAPVCPEQIFQPCVAASIIRKGDISIEVTESASAGFIAKVMEAVANAW